MMLAFMVFSSFAWSQVRIRQRFMAAKMLCAAASAAIASRREVRAGAVAATGSVVPGIRAPPETPACR
jgi:hypothetical protein